jgi:uncharacterized damage-inducible protein DinB
MVADGSTEETEMPGQAPPLPDERELLLAFLNQQRDGLRYAAYGLTDEQARLAPTASPLSVGGLLKHVISMEEGWVDLIVERRREGSQADYEENFRMAPGETLRALLARYDDVARDTEAIVRGIDDLGQDVPVPKGVPWYPDDIDAWSVRWVLLHLIEEVARHAGHADIVREAVDGATMYPLMAAAEGWPATDWMQPWEPAS